MLEPSGLLICCDLLLSDLDLKLSLFRGFLCLLLLIELLEGLDLDDIEELDEVREFDDREPDLGEVIEFVELTELTELTDNDDVDEYEDIELVSPFRPLLGRLEEVLVIFEPDPVLTSLREMVLFVLSIFIGLISILTRLFCSPLILSASITHLMIVNISGLSDGSGFRHIMATVFDRPSS